MVVLELGSWAAYGLRMTTDARRERFYEEITDSQKVEFIDGKVIEQPPSKVMHSDALGAALCLLGLWVDMTEGKLLSSRALCVFTRNDYMPDLVYFGPSKTAGITKDTSLFPVPDFVVEILSEWTEKYDRGVKFRDYAAHRVQEYWIIDPRDESLEQYLLGEDGEFSLQLKSTAGDVTSQVLCGLSIPIRSIFDDQLHLGTMRRLIGKNDT